MLLILTFPSALEYWLQAEKHPSDYLSFEDICLSPFSHSPADPLLITDKLKMKLPLHIMVPGSEQRPADSNFLRHRMPKHLPPNSFVKIFENVFVIRPELCFLLAANHYEIPELVRVANDLCSIYKVDPSSSFRQSAREQITDTKQITAFLQQVHNVHGIKKALQAIPYASDRSNSPIESILAAIARLPLFRGGFALPKLRLNHEIVLSDDAAAFLGQKTCCCDLVWIEKLLAAEYDSNMTHLTAAQHIYDKKRATALMMSGYTVISITWGHLQNPQKVETVFLELRRILDLYNSPARFQKYAEQRKQTIKQLLYKRSM